MVMMRRRGMARGVMRTAATTAVVVGTARAVGGAMDSHAASKQAQQQAVVDDQQQAQYDAQQQAQYDAQLQQQQLQMQQMQAQMAQMQQPPPAPAPVAAAAATSGISDGDMAKLKQLAELHTAGVLSDTEFESAKQKILG
jgi:hypothetical protein